MCSDSIHDAVLCAERRARTPARSIDAAIVKEPRYGCDCRLANGIYRHNSPHHISGVPVETTAGASTANRESLFLTAFYNDEQIRLLETRDQEIVVVR